MSKLICEKCGQNEITLEEYLAVDITKTAMCAECKEKRVRKQAEKVSRYTRRTGYAGRNIIR